MPSTGKRLIVGILLLAALAAGANLFYQRSLVRRARQFWGGPAAMLMARAPRVFALELAPLRADEGAAEVVEVGGQRLAVRRRRDLAEARGLLNIRRALVSDSSFAWDEPAGACQPQWTHGLVFSEASGSLTVVFSFDCPRAAAAGGLQAVSVRPLAAVLKAFFDEQF